MKNTCNFISPVSSSVQNEFYHFVFETNHKKLKRPFVRSNFYMYLVFSGSATLHAQGKEYPIEKGALFFTFPFQSFDIVGGDDFTYLYISFNGQGTEEYLRAFNVSDSSFVFYEFSHLLEFWMDSMRRINPSNSNVLTNCVFLYSLSFLNDGQDAKKDKFDIILDYVDKNCTSPDMSLQKVAGIFFYSEKYLSSLFSKKMKTKFTEYLQIKRVEKAVEYIKIGVSSISEITSLCGFRDRFYFSKVFKAHMGCAPSDFIKSIEASDAPNTKEL